MTERFPILEIENINSVCYNSDYYNNDISEHNYNKNNSNKSHGYVILFFAINLIVLKNYPQSSYREFTYLFFIY